MEWIETVFGTVIIFGCGLGLYGFGLWTGNRTDKPVGFWANGKPLDPKTVTDIPSYNRAFGKLFRIYSLPAVSAGVVMLISVFWQSLALVCLVILFLWGTIGIVWLIFRYKKIEKQYILR